MKYSITLNRSEKWSMSKPHQHDFLEILLCLNDGGSFFLKDAVFPLETGTLIVMQGNVLHESIATGKRYERYVLHVPRETLLAASGKKTDFLSVFKGNYCFKLDPKDFDQLRSLMEQCCTDSDDLGSDVLQDCAFLSLLVMVARLLPRSFASSSSGNGLSPSVFRAVDWINGHLGEDLSLDTLASQCYVTKYHLCRLFKSETGFTVGEYVLQQRLLRASSLLRRGESVQKAAEIAGFQNYNHFIRTFSHWMGISPGRYRHQKKAE